MLAAPTWSAASGTDALTGILNELRSRSAEQRTRAARALKTHVENIALELSGDTFARFMSDLNKRIGDLVQSMVEADRLGGIEAIEELIEVDSEERSSNLPRFANYLRVAIGSSEPVTINAATLALGHLARVGGALVSDAVEFEIRRSLDWLNLEKTEFKRIAALQVIQQLAAASPTLFHAHIGGFFEVVWSALRDQHQTVREAGTGALRAVLGAIASREGRAKLLDKLYVEAQRSLKSTPEAVHGGLLALNEMMIADAQHMKEYIRESCDIVFKLKDSGNKAVKRAAIQIMPALAACDVSLYVEQYLQASVAHLAAAVRGATDRSPAYVALGDLAKVRSPVETTQQYWSHS